MKKTLIPNRDKLQTYFKNGIRKINGNVEDEKYSKAVVGSGVFFSTRALSSLSTIVGGFEENKTNFELSQSLGSGW